MFLSSKIKLCIVIPAYNEEKHIRRTIQSCYNAGMEEKDVYVLDDGSTDKTARTAEATGCWVLSEENIGKEACIQRGIQHYSLFDRYDYICILDADSTLDTEYVRAIGRCITKYPEVAAISGAVRSQHGKWLTAYRAVETYLSTNVYREAQHFMGNITVAPGCSTTYNTSKFRLLDFTGAAYVIAEKLPGRRSWMVNTVLDLARKAKAKWLWPSSENLRESKGPSSGRSYLRPSVQSSSVCESRPSRASNTAGEYTARRGTSSSECQENTLSPRASIHRDTKSPAHLSDMPQHWGGTTGDITKSRTPSTESLPSMRSSFTGYTEALSTMSSNQDGQPETEQKKETHVACLVEDMDWTCQFHRRGEQVVQAMDAIVYTQDPATLKGLYGQVHRWHRGTWQVVRARKLCRSWTKIDAEFVLILGEALIYGAILFLLPLWYWLNPVRTMWAVVADQSILLFFVLLTAWRDKRWDVLYLWPLFIIPRLMCYFSFVWAFIRERRPRKVVWYSPERW